MFSCEFCEISKNTFFAEKLWMTASWYHKELLLGPFLVRSCALPEAVVRKCSMKNAFVIISQENTCVGVSFLQSYRLKTRKFIQKRPQHRSFLVYISKHLIWIGWYFVVVGWYFFDAVVDSAILNSCKVFLNLTGLTKSCFHVVGCHFSEFLFTFYLNLIGWSFFYSRTRQESWKFSTFFLSPFSARFFQMSR